MLKRAQALGDLEALRKHGRRVMRAHLGVNAIDGLKHLAEVLPLSAGSTTIQVALETEED